MFTLLPVDPYVSPDFNQDYAKLDNYQIYSIVLFDQSRSETITAYYPGNYRAEIDIFQTDVDGFQGGWLRSEPAPISIANEPSTYTPTDPTGYSNRTYHAPVPPLGDLAGRGIAFQSFSPLGKITFDLADIARRYPITASDYTVRYYSVYLTGDPYPRVQTESNMRGSAPDIQALYQGYASDSRVRPGNIRVLATSTRTIHFGYYRRNPYESHPNLYASLDWHFGSIKVVKDKPYILPLLDPMLGTLQVDTSTRAEILAVELPSTSYPTTALFLDAIPELFAYWESIRPAAPEFSDRPFYNQFWRRYFRRSTEISAGLILVTSSPIGDVFSESYLLANASPYGREIDGAIWQTVTAGVNPPTVRVIGASNDRWHFGTVTTSDKVPGISHPIFTIDEATFYERTQPDGSFGTYMVDSPRILEIHAALDAAKFAANDIDGNRPRVTNLGYWIEKCGNLLGHRPNADGLIDHTFEKAHYSRQRIPRPIWGNGQYSLNQFGSRGMCIPHLPNTYTGSGKLAKLYDVVYDIPQLLQALHDQVDIAQGIQHASQIRVKHTDGSIQSFPDMLSVQLETLTIAASMRESVARNQISAAVTGAEVRELFSAIGAPTSQKYLIFKDPTAGKVNQVPYFGHQQGKESITAGISTLKINLAIALGVLMPKAQPAKSKLNPFQILTKKA